MFNFEKYDQPHFHSQHGSMYMVAKIFGKNARQVIFVLESSEKDSFSLCYSQSQEKDDDWSACVICSLSCRCTQDYIKPG